jgi:DNA repair protein RecN (Recombination protein N)
MITTLHIKNIGIIEDLSIDLNKGLNVLTGETGAGKTLIIDALGIISGERFSKDIIRKGATNSFIEMCMYEPENENSIEGNIIISREINLNGKNLCKINGRMVTVTELKEFMKNFIEIHGQNANQNLLDNKKHINYVDEYIGKKIKEIKEEYKVEFREYNNLKQELKNNFGDEKAKQRKLDLLQYQLDEISEANLKIGEEEELEEKRKIILNSEKIVENLNEADRQISENSIDSISLSIRALEKIESIDEKYSKISSNLKNLYYELQEVSRDLNSFKEEIFFDEEERNQTEERLDLIKSLKRKYGNTIEEILEYKEEINKEINRIRNLDIYNENLRKKIKIVEENLNRLAKIMTKIRIEKSEILSQNINKELEDLEMKNAKVNIKVENCDEFNKNGKNQITFYIKTNLGEDEKELAKIASGGEMSRIMLAIKKVFSEIDKMPVMIFDEIDTGISGKAANSVGNKLKTISKNHQVICISHLPNIAANADFNYFISKKINNQRTNTEIKLLKEDEVIEEIARISSGEINEITLQYASELRKNCKKKIA